MRVGKAEWKGIAEAAAARFEGKPIGQQRELMAQDHRNGGQLPDTLIRMLGAREYALSKAKNSGVAFRDVICPYAAVELLERIERIDPARASDLSRGVFLGKTSARALTEVLAELRKPRPVTAVDERVYWEETVEAIFGSRLVSVSVKADGHSSRGKWLGVDYEADLKHDKRAALFLSPQCLLSTFARKPFLEQLPRVLAAMAYYDEVAYVAYDNDEKTSIEAMVSEGDWGGKQIAVYDPAPWNDASID